ncbi:hypothetical protein ACFOWX_08655 [Sphingorhabdus arenilitoris]|uniref:EpsG family protein n=1 Tax=Sphingorhabdus arenilitoris TaxID=1490041 RepID=A0ABV8RGI9_9SPHN
MIRRNARKLSRADSWVALLCVLFALIIVFSLLYPPLNWPDEIYKISTLHSSDNLYLRTLNWLQGTDCGFSYTSLPSGIFGTNKFQYQILSGIDCYRELKFKNAIMIFAVIAICLAITRKDKWQIFILSLMWPSSLFFLTSVNNQVVFHVISIALGVYALSYKKLFLPIILSLFLIFVDRSFITTLIFFSLVQGFRVNVKVTAALLFAFFVFSQATGGLLEEFYGAIVGVEGSTLSSIQDSNEVYRDSLVISFGILGVSFVYLGGTAAVFGIIIDYIFVYTYIMRNFLNLGEKKEIYNYFFSFIITFILVIQFVPSIQSFRYYVFLMPILLNYLLPGDHRKYYIYYCMIMSFAYILIGYLFQGATI